MDGVTLTMLVSAISAALASGAKVVVESAVKDAYSAVKSKISETFGAESKPSKAIQQYEENSDEDVYKAVLETELQNNDVLADDDLKLLTVKLIQALQQTEAGQALYTKFLNQGETTIGLQGDGATVYGGVVGKKK